MKKLHTIIILVKVCKEEFSYNMVSFKFANRIFSYIETLKKHSKLKELNAFLFISPVFTVSTAFPVFT